MKPVIITGGIASGKSTVLNVWRDMGVQVASPTKFLKKYFLENRCNKR
ncbi:MAG: dephospho-CoA kinase [Fimbriimonadaceae bacterium]|nr:dephospho-CoA kinase [Fimbriimonadaceae bacterium]